MRNQPHSSGVNPRVIAKFAPSPHDSQMNHISLFNRPVTARISFPGVLVAATMLAMLTAPMSSTALGQRDPDRPKIETLLPETTLAILQVADVRDLMGKLQATEGMAFFEEEDVAPLAERIFEEGRNAYEKVEEDVGLSLDEIQSLPSGEMVIALVAPRRKKPALLFIVEVDDDNEAVDKALKVVEEKSEVDGEKVEDGELEAGVEVRKMMLDDQRVFMARRDGLVIYCQNEDVLNDIFLRWDGQGDDLKARPLTNNRSFVTIMNRCASKKGLEPELKFFVNPIALYKSFARVQAEMQAGLLMIAPLGLDSLEGFGGAVILGDEDYDMIFRGHLHLSSPRKGVTKVISLKPDDYELEDWMPSEAHSYMTTSWDVPQMYNEIRRLVDLLGEGTFDNFVKENIDDEMEMSFENEVLAQFSGRISLSQITSVPGKMNSSSWIVGMRLKDTDEATEVAEKIVEFLNGDDGNIEASMHEGVKYWSVSQDSIDERNERREKRRRERAKQRGREFNDNSKFRATLRIPRPTVSIVEDTLIFTDSIEAFEQVVATSNGDAESLKNDADFIAMQEKMIKLLGTDMPVAMSYSQPEKQLQAFIEYASSDATKTLVDSYSEDNEFFKVLKGVMDDHELPSMEVWSKYLKPQGWFATSDDQGYHMLWFQEKLHLED